MHTFFVTHPAAAKAAWRALHGGVAGLVTAVQLDRESFAQWNSLHDIRQFDWNVALFKYGKGFVLGASTGAGLSGILSTLFGV